MADDGDPSDADQPPVDETARFDLRRQQLQMTCGQCTGQNGRRWNTLMPCQARVMASFTLR